MEVCSLARRFKAIEEIAPDTPTDENEEIIKMLVPDKGIQDNTGTPYLNKNNY